jgi:hypothetical protein
MFTYCTQVLHLSEHAAYNRIEAARAARRYPKILEGLAAGELTLTAVRLLAPSLTVENHEAVLQSARHKTRREVEHLVAAMRPQADVPATLRKLPARRRGGPRRPPRLPRATPAVKAKRSWCRRNGWLPNRR